MERKGVEKGIEIVIVVVVLLILAVALVMFFSSNLQKAGESNKGTIDQSDDSIKFNLCQLKCDECKRLYANGCSSKWSTFQGNDGSEGSCDKIVSCS